MAQALTYDSFSLVPLQGFLCIDSLKALFQYIGVPFKLPFLKLIRKPHIAFEARRGALYLAIACLEEGLGPFRAVWGIRRGGKQWHPNDV